MSTNPFSDEKTEAMEELQPKPVPQTPVAANQYPVIPPGAALPPPADAESEEIHSREDALTVKFAIGKLNDYLQWFLMVLETILLLRFVLKMFGADPRNPFASFIFTLTDVLLVPFRNILPQSSLGGYQAFEFSTLFAILIYFLIIFALKRFLRILISSPEEPVE